MTLRAASAGATCPACGVGTPAGARFCPACGQRLLGGGDERRVVTVLFAGLVDSTRLAPALRRAGRAFEADAAAKRVLEDATAMGAHALVRRLARQGEDGR